MSKLINEYKRKVTVEQVQQRGNFTLVQVSMDAVVTHPEVAVGVTDKLFGTGFSKCNLKLDKFDADLGREIAFGRAVQDLIKQFKD